MPITTTVQVTIESRPKLPAQVGSDSNEPMVANSSTLPRASKRCGLPDGLISGTARRTGSRPMRVSAPLIQYTLGQPKRSMSRPARKPPDAAPKLIVKLRMPSAMPRWLAGNRWAT